MREKKAILAVPAVFLGILAAVSLIQSSSSSLRLQNNFDIVARHVKREMNHGALSAKTVILGDSTAFFNLNPRFLPDSISLAASYATIRESYYTLRHLIDSGIKPKCVLASFSFQWHGADRFFWPMFVRNGFFSSADLSEIYRVQSSAHEAPGGDGILSFWANVFLYRAKVFGGSLGHLRNFIWPDKETETVKRDFRDALIAGSGWFGLTDLSRFSGDLEMKFPSSPHASPAMAVYAKMFRDLIEEHGIRFFLLDVPLSPKYSLNEREEYERAYASAASQLLESGNTIHLKWPVLPEKYFFKAGHLFKYGSDKAMPFIADKIRGCSAR